MSARVRPGHQPVQCWVCHHSKGDFMTRFIALALLLPALCSCRSEPPPSSPATATFTETQKGDIDKRNQALVKQHDEVWALMGLSANAQEELKGIVTAVNTQAMKNKFQGQTSEHAAAVKRAPDPLTHDEFIASHRKRFDLLKISAPTQKELLGAAEFVWTALHDEKAPFTEEQRKTAQVIQDMMKKMKGPPPCCDDNIFQRAQAPRKDEG